MEEQVSLLGRGGSLRVERLLRGEAWSLLLDSGQEIEII